VTTKNNVLCLSEYRDEIHLESTMRLCFMKLLEAKDIFIDIIYL
jgi:hypothetical protein